MTAKKYHKVTLYIPEEDHRQLKAKLALLGQNLSEWVRNIIKKFLE